MNQKVSHFLCLFPPIGMELSHIPLLSKNEMRFSIVSRKLFLFLGFLFLERNKEFLVHLQVHF